MTMKPCCMVRWALPLHLEHWQPPTVQSVMGHRRPQARSPQSSPISPSCGAYDYIGKTPLRETASSPIPNSVKLLNTSSFSRRPPGPSGFRHKFPPLPPVIAKLVSPNPRSYVVPPFGSGGHDFPSETLPTCVDPPSKSVSARLSTTTCSPLIPAKRNAYAACASPPDSSWSTLPAAKKAKPPVRPHPGNSPSMKKSGPFKLSLPFTKNQKTHKPQSTSSKVRVTTYLPPPPSTSSKPHLRALSDQPRSAGCPRVGVSQAAPSAGRVIPLLKRSRSPTTDEQES